MKIDTSEIKLQDELIYLNHAGMAPWPKRTVDAVTQFAQQNLTTGSQSYPRWLGAEMTLRRQLKQLINAPSVDDIALLKSTSEAISFVAAGIDWQPSDTIVTSNEEFPSNRYAWEALQSQGVNLKQVPLRQPGKSPEECLIEACDAQTRMIAISSVQFASGLRVNLEKLGAFTRANGILLCVDAIQTLGALDFDVQACQADFVMADGHKWMLGPEGVALFYVRAELREQLKLQEYGWHMVEDVGNYDAQAWQPATSARRFECGSPNMLGTHALSASLSLLLELGMPAVEARVIDNVRFIHQYVAASRHLTLNSENEAGRFAGIARFTHQEQSADEVYQRLARNNVMCAVRAGAVRFSPHFYNDTDQIEQALKIAEGQS